MVEINGKSLEAAGRTIAEYLADAGYDPKVLVVERNGEIVSKTRYSEIIMLDDDVIEIVSFVGGG